LKEVFRLEAAPGVVLISLILTVKVLKNSLRVATTKSQLDAADLRLSRSEALVMADNDEKESLLKRLEVEERERTDLELEDLLLKYNMVEAANQIHDAAREHATVVRLLHSDKPDSEGEYTLPIEGPISSNPDSNGRK